MLTDIQNTIHNLTQSLKNLLERLEKISSDFSAVLSVIDKIFASRGMEVLVLFFVFSLFFRFFGAFFDLSRKLKMFLSFITVSILWSHINYIIFGAYRLDEILILYFWMFLPFLTIYIIIYGVNFLKKRFFIGVLNPQKKNDLVLELDEMILKVKKSIIKDDLKTSENLLLDMAKYISNIKIKND